MAMLARIAEGVEDARNADFERELGMESGKLPLSTLEIAPKLEARRSPKLDAVIQWFRENPIEANQSNRKIAEQLGVSHPLVGQARKIVESDENEL